MDSKPTFTGKDIIALGFKSGKHIPLMIARANELGYCTYGSLVELLPPEPKLIPLQEGIPFNVNMTATTQDELNNQQAVIDTMTALMQTPFVKAGTVLPDACPAGPVGTIPVGGVVASEHIHPGMHSADVCCSVMITVFDKATPEEVLSAVKKRTHFGAGGRGEFKITSSLRSKIRNNQFLADLEDIADFDLGTQGDGNHFSFVGQLESTGKTALVTHHGSRRFGARLFKKGMKLAQKYTKELSPKTLKQNAWIPNNAEEFNAYWEALQIVREWTKLNHQTIHDIGFTVLENYWNEHNFVFKRNGIYYHAKGATPAFKDWANDATDKVIIPLNMAQPVLIVTGNDSPNALGFCPHGAGRNYSRTQHELRGNYDFDEETKGLDITFWSGVRDPSEFPSAYKNASSVINDIEKYDLATVVDKVLPYGSIMNGKKGV